MTDKEISKALALAIGWAKHDVDASGYWVFVCYEVATLAQPATWRIFDYRNPTVIWPIAERYNCFPKRMITEWVVMRFDMKTYGDTAAKAVALAVIGLNAPK